MSRRISGAALKVVPAAPSVPPAPRAPRAPAAPRTGVIDQVRTAMKPNARLASLVGFILGGFVPLATFVLAHYEIDYSASASLWSQVAVYVAIAGCAYSAPTVVGWGTQAFGSTVKALGFAALLEGTMISARTAWLGFAALALLIAINGTATACRLHAKGQQ